MEADWEVEIGAGAPVIEARWPGFVDLRFDSDAEACVVSARARNLPEAVALPALADALVRLNGLQSPVWTSKCDVWPVLDSSTYDPDEMEAEPGNATHAWACYLDLLPKSDQQWITPGMAVRSCRAVCAQLQTVPLSCCRVDLIVRRALITPDLMDHGITAYLTACGPTSESANQGLAHALTIFVDAVWPGSTVE